MAENARFYQTINKYDYERALNSKRIDFLTDDDRTILRRYVMEVQAQKQISDSRANKIVFMLIQWRCFILRPWREIQIDDVYQGIGNLKKGKSFKGTLYLPNTQHDFVQILKPFLRWLNDEKIISIPEKESVRSFLRLRTG